MLTRHAASADFRFVTRGFVIAWLGLLSMPASAASGLDMLCDESAEQSAELDVSAKLDVHVDTLAADIVDHEEALGVAANSPTSPADLDSPPAPLSELRSSSVRDSTSELTEASPADSLTGDDNLPGPSSRFPGMSDDEALRYRSEMYRTDI